MVGDNKHRETRPAETGFEKAGKLIDLTFGTGPDVVNGGQKAFVGTGQGHGSHLGLNDDDAATTRDPQSNLLP